jgi:hypothetical protein
MILNVITMELMIFIPAPIANMAYAQRKSAVSWNTDLTDDSLFFMVKLVADGDTQFVRSIYTLAANIGQARSSLWRIILENRINKKKVV